MTFISKNPSSWRCTLHCRGLILYLFCFVTVVATSTQGAVVSTVGQVALIDPPSSVQRDAIGSDTVVFAFEESTNVFLNSGLAVDITTPTTANQSGGATPGIISAGTRVDSYFLHRDPDIEPGFASLTGSITFNSDVLGVALSDATLDESDGILGFPMTIYPTGVIVRGAANGLEQQDFVTLSTDRRTVDFSLFTTSDGIDQVRIITATAIPEPTSFAVLFLGAIWFSVRVKRRLGKIA